MFRLIFLLIVLFNSTITMAITYTVEISEAELQKKVLAMMPIEKNKPLFSIKLSQPDIELIEGSNLIGVFTHIDVNSPLGIKGSGRAKIIGSLSYDAASSEFFFKNTIIERLEIDKVSEKYTSQIKGLVQSVTRKLLAKRPIYKLKDNNLKHKFAKAMLQSIAVKDKKLFIKLSVL